MSVSTKTALKVSVEFHDLTRVQHGHYLQSKAIKVDKATFFIRLYPFGKTQQCTEMQIVRTGEIWRGNVQITLRQQDKHGALYIDNYEHMYVVSSFKPNYTQSLCINFVFLVDIQVIDIPLDWDDDISELCDVIIKVGNEVIPACKTILALRSPVFKAMFNSGMVESRSNEIVIDDFNADSVKAFIKVLHVQTVYLEQFSLPVCFDICKLAHKYCTARLGIMCLYYLNSHVTVHNCIDMLILAEDCNFKELKQSVIDFFTKNKAECIANNEEKFNGLNKELLLILLRIK